MNNSKIEGGARAFWRRIEMYKNDHGKELPKPLPVEFMASMSTALMLIDYEGMLNHIDKLEALRAAAENYKAEFERTQGRSLIDRWGIVHALEALNK